MYFTYLLSVSYKQLNKSQNEQNLKQSNVWSLYNHYLLNTAIASHEVSTAIKLTQ